jgi:Lar family restriction alleviation protein
MLQKMMLIAVTEKGKKMKENELKPCPFCGGEAVLYHQSSKYTDYDGDYVHCMHCGCRTKLFECFNGTGKTHEDTEREAVNAWNRRADNEQREAD